MMRLPKLVKLVCVMAFGLAVLTTAARAADQPPIHDCLEGAGDDLKSVSIEDLRFPPPPPPPPSS